MSALSPKYPTEIPTETPVRRQRAALRCCRHRARIAVVVTRLIASLSKIFNVPPVGVDGRAGADSNSVRNLSPSDAHTTASTTVFRRAPRKRRGRVRPWSRSPWCCRNILFGSAAPNDDITRHTGAARITRLRMLPMSLFETGDATGAISLAALLAGEAARSPESTLTVTDLATLVGGRRLTRQSHAHQRTGDAGLPRLSRRDPPR